MAKLPQCLNIYLNVKLVAEANPIYRFFLRYREPIIFLELWNAETQIPT